MGWRFAFCFLQICNVFVPSYCLLSGSERSSFEQFDESDDRNFEDEKTANIFEDFRNDARYIVKNLKLESEEEMFVHVRPNSLAMKIQYGEEYPRQRLFRSRNYADSSHFRYSEHLTNNNQRELQKQYTSDTTEDESLNESTKMHKEKYQRAPLTQLASMLTTTVKPKPRRRFKRPRSKLEIFPSQLKSLGVKTSGRPFEHSIFEGLTFLPGDPIPVNDIFGTTAIPTANKQIK
ncbi:hypothetical protein M3Y94_00579200 [Aphelenchoides besseyi]|nr:hypothetical protein M3Y94_00579200 [Aphelenchoides besseyi]